MNGNFFENLIEQRLLDMHTAYIGKVLSIDGEKAKVQPLGMYKQYGETAKKQAVVSAVIATRYKVTKMKEITYVEDSTLNVSKNGDGVVSGVTISNTKQTKTIPIVEELKAGHIVICVCCDRDITEARQGNNAVPAVGHHSLSDSVIVGIL